MLPPPLFDVVDEDGGVGTAVGGWRLSIENITDDNITGHSGGFACVSSRAITHYDQKDISQTNNNTLPKSCALLRLLLLLLRLLDSTRIVARVKCYKAKENKKETLN